MFNNNICFSLVQLLEKTSKNVCSDLTLNIIFFAHWVISLVWQCNKDKDLYFCDVDNYFVRAKGDVDNCL